MLVTKSAILRGVNRLGTLRAPQRISSLVFRSDFMDASYFQA
jgi:hypothetical protein